MTRKVAGGPARLEQCRGHLRWRVSDLGRERVVHVHQLALLAQGADPGQVFSDGEWHVHHGDGVRWDNRPCNISLEHEAEHNALEKLGAGPWALNWADLPVADLGGRAKDRQQSGSTAPKTAAGDD